MRSSQPIPTPCVKTCYVDPESGFCMGCGRTRDEISLWPSYSQSMRDRLSEELPKRVRALHQRLTEKAAETS